MNSEELIKTLRLTPSISTSSPRRNPAKYFALFDGASAIICTAPTLAVFCITSKTCVPSSLTEISLQNFTNSSFVIHLPFKCKNPVIQISILILPSFLTLFCIIKSANHISIKLCCIQKKTIGS